MSSVTIIGLDELNALFKTFPQGVAKAFQMAGTNYAKLVYNEANRTVPVDTGALKRSIGYTINQRELRIYANIHYAYYVNFGTSRMPGRPFLTSPAEKNEDQLLQEFADMVITHFKG